MLWLCHDITQKSFQKKYTYASFIPPGYICFLRLHACIANEIIDECPQKSGEKNPTGFSTSMVRGFGHEISVTQFIRVYKKRVVVGESYGIYGWSPFSKRDTFLLLLLVLALDFKGYIQFLRRSSKSKRAIGCFWPKNSYSIISLLFFCLNKRVLPYVCGINICRNKLHLARVDISSFWLFMLSVHFLPD